METLVVQTGIRHGRIAELMRSSNGSFTVGRGFDNDLVLTDPHVAPQQLKFVCEDSGWKLVVLDDTNPVTLNGVNVTGRLVDVKTGDRVTVGRAKLSLFAEDHPVGETKKLHLLNWLSGKPSNPLVPFALLLLAGLVDFCVVFFETSTNLKWEEPAMLVLASTLLILVWAGIWAIAGRIARHQHQFGTQLIVTAVLGIFSTALVTAVGYLVYPFQNASVQELADWLVAFMTLALLLRFNLMIATNVRRPVIVACVVTSLVIATLFGLTYLGKAKLLEFEPVYSSSLKPPILRVFDGVSADGYFLDVAATVQNLDDRVLKSTEQQ